MPTVDFVSFLKPFRLALAGYIRTKVKIAKYSLIGLVTDENICAMRPWKIALKCDSKMMHQFIVSTLGIHINKSRSGVFKYT